MDVKKFIKLANHRSKKLKYFGILAGAIGAWAFFKSGENYAIGTSLTYCDENFTSEKTE